MNKLPIVKSPYSVRLRKLTPRTSTRTARHHHLSATNEVLLPRPVKTRATHRLSSSLGDRDLGTLKVNPPKLFALRFDLDVKAIPFKPNDMRSVRHRQLTPKDVKQCALYRVFTKTRISPKAGTYHRRTLSLVEDYLESLPIGIKEQPQPSPIPELSSISSWSYATRTGVMPGNPGKVNQDSYLAVQRLSQEHTGASLFGIFDGHGQYGHEVSQLLKVRIPKTLINDPGFLDSPVRALTHCVVRCNQEVLMGMIDSSLSGSTLNILLLHETQVWCANVGDSRSLVGRKNGDSGLWTAQPLSRDHKPDCIDEAERIIHAGGRIASYQDEDGSPLGPARVWLKHQDTPGLAMSRSIGDAVAASAGVIGIPEITHLTLTTEDKFLVVGSDGVFEFLQNEEVVQIVSKYWEEKDVQGACKALEKEAYLRWAQVCRT